MLMAKLITREMLANLGHCGSFRWTILDAIPPGYSIFDSSGYDARGACLSRLVSFFYFFFHIPKISRDRKRIYINKKKQLKILFS